MTTKGNRSILIKIWLGAMFTICIVSTPSFHELGATTTTNMPVEIKDGSMMLMKSRIKNFNNIEIDGNIAGWKFNGREFIHEGFVEQVPGTLPFLPIVHQNSSDKSTERTENGTDQGANKGSLNFSQLILLSLSILVGTIIGILAASLFADLFIGNTDVIGCIIYSFKNITIDITGWTNRKGGVENE